MDLIWNIVFFAFGIGLLIKGSDWLVEASAKLAKQFGVSNFIIGLTIVALGTSLPELGTEVMASLYGNSEIVLGDIIGSNIANLALVLGLAGLFVPIVVKKHIYKRDGTIMLGTTILFYLLCLDGVLTAFEGGFFLFLFLSYIYFLIRTKKPYKRDLHFRRYLWQYSDLEEKQKFESPSNLPKILRTFFFSGHISASLKKANLFLEKIQKSVLRHRQALGYSLKQIGLILIGAVCIFFGANFVVTNAMEFPISQLAVGLVFIAIGTSLPELVITITSLRKGLPELMIGNLIGSNIANILWVGGISAIIAPVIVPISVITIDFIFLLFVSWMFLVFLRNDNKITGIESITMILLYVLFVATALGIRLGV